MPLWGNAKSNTASPIFTPMQFHLTPNTVNQAAIHANNTVDSFFPGQATGVFGANSSEASTGKGAHSGWVKVTRGTGPVANLVINSGGTAYKNNDVLTVSGGTTNATATPTTNSTGGIVSLALGAVGAGFANVGSLTVAFANSTGGATSGSGANVSVLLGGRASRTQYETLVCTSVMTGSGTTLPT